MSDALNSDPIVPFGKYKGQPVEVMAADTDYCEWLTAQQWFRGKYRNLYKALTNHGAEPQGPVASTTPPVPVFVGRTGPELPETAEWWPPWEDPPVPGCLAESGIPVTGLVWCPVHGEYEELREGVPAVRLHGGVSRSVVAPAGACAPAHREPAPVRQPRPGACGVGRAAEE